MMVVSPGGAVMVTGMLTAVDLALVLFFRLSESSCLSVGDGAGLELKPSPSASVSLSLENHHRIGALNKSLYYIFRMCCYRKTISDRVV